ncbi:MAG: acyl-CoA dehydrogenase [Candidatus Obscuribacter sp.]|nr:acyl-CoA dehydrogenase [Candidatus Melainabacteria bacterium]MBK8220918.1 acyl-CoA dehydrogenase [Candidatus Obscuribacter sp.]MBK9279512.1 acyl-CoA dehydrogenase [Candidatus Obscuribacter sp.]MBL8081416.1 acyl-CoA dehydrogenase [Candidatus Obscuribacter sp.]
MTFALTEEQVLIQETVREMAQAEFAPKAAEVDQKHRFPRENFELLASSDLCGLPFPEKYGGAGMDNVSYAIVVEELAKACATTSVIYSAHVSLCAKPIYIFGTEEQKEKFLVPLCQGKKLGAFALSEPGSGSDAAAAKCTAVRKGDHYILNGSKNWITNGIEADYYLVIAQTDASLKHKGLIALIVEKGTPGFTFGKLEDKLGIKGSSTCQINFEDSPVPVANMLAGPQDGFKVSMVTLDGGRIGIAAQAVGIAQGAWDHAFKYSKERIAFNQTINKFQAIQFMLAEMQTEIDAARLLTFNAARGQDLGVKITKEAAHAKLFAAEVAMRSTVKCVQIFGGYGYVTDYPAERYMRDAKITEIYEGTSEVQRLVIAQNVLKGL